MNAMLDLTDVLVVTPSDLALPMELLIENERALVLLNGASAVDIRIIEEAYWARYRGETARGVAVLVRFWRLIEVFAARRLRELFLDCGYAVIDPALATAATMRLNTKWGFNPHNFLCRLRAALEDAQSGRIDHSDELVLAA